VASDLVIRLYFDAADFAPPQRFVQLAETLLSWEPAETALQEVAVESSESRNFVLQEDGPLDLDQLTEAIAAFQSQDLRLSTGLGFECWRFRGGQQTRGGLRAELDVWGPEFSQARLRDPDLDGFASISISNPGPYCALPETAEDPMVHRAQALNAFVRQNLDQLTDLVLLCIEGTRPKGLKVFVDEGWPLPLNAHYAYYPGFDGVLADLMILQRIWLEGLPRYNGVPPLRDFDAKLHEFTLHTWREADARRSLWEQLGSVLPHAHKVTENHVRELLGSQRFDFYEMQPGILLLESPHPLNNFLDRFYLELLRLAAD